MASHAAAAALESVAERAAGGRGCSCSGAGASAAVLAGRRAAVGAVPPRAARRATPRAARTRTAAAAAKRGQVGTTASPAEPPAAAGGPDVASPPPPPAPPVRRVRKVARSKPAAPSYGDASSGALWSATSDATQRGAFDAAADAASADEARAWAAAAEAAGGADTMKDRMRIAAAVGAAADAADAAAAASLVSAAALAKADKAERTRARRAVPGAAAKARGTSASSTGLAVQASAGVDAGARPGAATAAALRALPPGVSLADVLREKFRERRERSLLRVRAQLRSSAEGDADPAAAANAVADTADAAAISGSPLGPGAGLSNAIDWRTLTVGEFIVHKTYGVGCYLGSRRVAPRPDAPPEDYLFVKYADGTAKLRASSAARLVYRYRTPGDARSKAPKLCSLHDPSSWQRRQAKGRLAIQRLVNTLMDVYLERVMVTRPPYPEVPAHVAEQFAAGFPYPLTADQAAAVEDIYTDMGRDTPMDRLVIGDVGFGKTEVAMRAVLQAVLAGKQVLVLTPTTVLARQHAGLFGARFAALGVRCGFLTRFTPLADRREIVAAMADGSMRLVVGTHALLAEAEFCPNLGLLVVDEEQRFGVRHKERITALQTAVDVLTMSATPIPRTLHMALAGFRDASVIATPPPGRRPIDTQLLPFNEQQVVDSIRAELARGGQVFYVVPRIEAMPEKLTRLRRLLPGLAVQAAHGRMGAGELEETMEAFSQAAFDVLVCTTIVESGLDLPRVNTIIIEDVHMFGLASLYQLRGRVGRNDQQAHALLFWDPSRELTAEAAARLAAVRDCCGLGEGFRLAERDMAIRGVGAVFGDKQSGDVSHVGVDLYLEMLYEQLAGVEGQRLPTVAWDDVDIRIPLRGAVPPSVVASEADARQLAARAEAAGREGPAALKALAAEVERSTGAMLPKPLHSLLRGYALRWYASELGVSAVHADVPGLISLETDMSEATFYCIDGLLAEPERAALRWEPGRIAVRVACAAAEMHTWRLQPEMHAERAIAALAALHAAAPKFLRYV